MEWFPTSRGEVVFGEVACRPGGACVVDLMNYTSDIDLFREWARVATLGRFEASTQHYDRYRPHIVEDTLLRPGAPRRDWKATLLSDGYLVVRHPDWDQAHRMALAAATDIQLYAS